MILEKSKYNDSIGEWQLKGIAFAGNNLQELVSYLSRTSIILIWFPITFVNLLPLFF